MPFGGAVDTLFEAALARCPVADGFAAPVVVAGTKHLDHVEGQLGGIAGAEVIVEPAARNTAAAIALAAYRRRGDADLPERLPHR